MATLRDIMTEDLIIVEPSCTVAEAATIMGRKHVGSTLVMDGGALAGIFTERDIIRALSQDFDAHEHPVTQWMTKHPVTLGGDATVKEALDLMLRRGFRHLPIVEGDRVAGMVSMRDLSRALAEDA